MKVCILRGPGAEQSVVDRTIAALKSRGVEAIEMQRDVTAMFEEAVDCETQFAEDLLSGGVAGLSVRDMRQYLEYTADQRLSQLGMPRR